MKSRKRKRPTKVFINGDWWKLDWKKDPCCDGEYVMGMCSTGLKTITVDEELEGVELTNTLIHEMLHGIFPMLHEDAVTLAADDIAEALAECRVIKI